MLPTNSISMTDLTHDTTLEDTDQVVLFDTSEAKRATLDEVKTFVLNGNIEDIPAPPTADGTYTLKVTVSSGVPTYAWV